MKPDLMEKNWQNLFHLLNLDNRKKCFQFGCHLINPRHPGALQLTRLFFLFLFLLSFTIPASKLFIPIVIGGSLALALNVHVFLLNWEG